MLKFIRVFSVGVLVMFVTGSTNAASIKFDPTTSIHSNGDNFSISILSESISDLYAFQFSIGFDSALIQAINITEGGFLSQFGTTFFIPGSIDNVAGYIDFTGNTLIGAISGASGSGVLATVDFKASGEGISQLSFSDLLFLDSNLDEIPVSIFNGSVNVTTSGTGSTVPEPAIWSLLAIGFLAMRKPV